MKKITFTLFVYLCFVSLINAQDVTTFFDGTPDDAIVVDSNGNIYCSNYVGDSVFKFTPEGVGTAFITGLITPNGLAINSNNELFVCDGQGNRIYKYDLDGNLITFYNHLGHPSGIIKSPNSDAMIFTEYLGNKINMISSTGIVTEISSAPQLAGPVGIAFDENDNLYVGNYNNRTIYKVLPNGDLDFVALLPNEGGTIPNLGFITYAQGRIWATIMGNNKIYMVNPNGINDFEVFAGSSQGGADGDISIATFNTPNGITFNDAEDTMYVTDFGTKNLRIISNIALSNEEFELDNRLIQIFPNPVKDKIKIQTFEAIDIEVVRLYNLEGKLVSEQHTPSHEIDLSSMMAGVYFIEISTNKGVVNKKIIKD
ncbi:SMP-30/gluconolactonase/LRE family protein [uncultured Psychroserpens sp.]|uniref:virginiamycin B lyase family protein n=1 Tax=uncultured Psychroserpens sp. TaxID=255436 RepID=UPI0026029128|nr:SMP-30/gluconolactonase/LRE family protein [uncultured Psychroserpens sp.]